MITDFINFTADNLATYQFCTTIGHFLTPQNDLPLIMWPNFLQILALYSSIFLSIPYLYGLLLYSALNQMK